MSDAPPPARPQREHSIPTSVVSLRAQMDAAPDYVAPLAVLAILVALLGTTCLPLATVASMLASGERAIEQPAIGEDPFAPATQPDQAAQPARPPVQIPLVTLVGVLVFFLIAVMGIVAGIATILRKNWGRRLLIAFAALVLLYLVTAVYLRLRFGIEGLTETAPTSSALSLSITCSLGAIVVTAVLMIAILRYFTLPHIVRRFH